MATFPDVPVAPGVPPLPRPAGQLVETIALLSGDAVAVPGEAAWGIYQNGFPVVTPDTYGSFEFKRDWSIADYPVEQGGFESYDKVDMPFTAMLRLIAGGPLINRQALLAQIEAIAETTQRYDIVTPERVYTSVSVLRYNYRQTSNDGVGMLIVELWILEVRVTAADNGENTKSPSGANPSSGGNVQPSKDVPPTEGSVQSFQNGVTPGPGAGDLGLLAIG